MKGAQPFPQIEGVAASREEIGLFEALATQEGGLRFEVCNKLPKVVH